MSIGRLVECEMLQHDWSRMYEANGSAERIPIAFSELLQAQGPDEAVRAYWKLENHVVVQGALFEVSVSTVSLIGAALATPARPKWVMIQLFELLFQIVSGESHADEISRGFGDLGKQCRTEAKKIVWLLYRFLLEGEFARPAGELLDKIDDQPGRIRILLRPI